MDLFVSKYFNKIDKKGRISLPSSFRNVLPKANKNEIILYKYNKAFIQKFVDEKLNRFINFLDGAMIA